MSGAALGAAFGAMQVIYAAYRDIKTNKEKCTALVHRAEIVVEELKLFVGRQVQEEEMIAERIRALLLAFETTAQVIRQIGRKNWLKALLDADRDAIHVEHCHHCLTDLMFLFNIEQGLDQWNIQQENERARERDHQDLLRVAQSVQSGLTTQGEIIGEVLDMVRTLSQSPTFNAYSPAHDANQVSLTSHTRGGAGSPNARRVELGCPEISKFQPTTKRHMDRVGARDSSSMTASQTHRRGSWMNQLGLQRISAIRIPIPGVGSTYPGRTQRVSRPKPMRAKKSSISAPKREPRISRALLKASPNSNDSSSLERGRKHSSSQPKASQATSPVAQLSNAPGTQPNSRSASSSPRGLKYVEVRYYSGDTAGGVLLSEAFRSLGKTTIQELRLASSHPTHPGKLSRLNEGNFVMEISGSVHPEELLNVSPWVGIQGPYSIVWALGSCGKHLEPIKVSIVGCSHFEWALVPCDMSTLVQDVMSIITNLTNREAVGCFRQEGLQTYRMENSRLLWDCGVGRGMYLEVEVTL